jgi:hypothetical protein
MPRNGSGTMTVANSFSAGATIASSQVNANFTDFASEVTGSLPRNGEAGMSGQFKGASGTVLLPGIAFGADTDCGFYRIGADNVGLAIGGVKVMDISSTGVAITGQLTTTNGPIPSGTKMLFYADSAPTGWTIFTTSINDKALRVVSGSGAGGGTGGATGGTTAFTSVFAARTITASEIPNLTITVTDPGHTHPVTSAVTSTSFAGGGAAGAQAPTSTNTSSATTGISAAFGNTARGGAQTAIDFAVQYASVIICTKDA